MFYLRYEDIEIKIKTRLEKTSQKIGEVWGE